VKLKVSFSLRRGEVKTIFSRLSKLYEGGGLKNYQDYKGGAALTTLNKKIKITIDPP
jgi:hypothetical protein